MKNNKQKVVLLDAHAIIHRAYHALPDFATSKGEPTGALYGLVLMILKIISDLKPDYIIACYDLPKPTYRHEVYEGYKAGRAKTDDSLSLQLEKSKKICEVLNIPIYSKEGFEADDMLGTIVNWVFENSKNTEIIIASGDMDTLQLVEDENKHGNSVKVYTLKKGIKDTILYDKKAVFERYGFEPKYLVDFKGLRGDPSDNIIGISGIGEKSAIDLISNFGSIENIYRELKNPKSEIHKKIKSRIIELLKGGEEEALFSKMLATIRRDAPIDFKLPEKKWGNGLNLEEAGKFFNELEFRTMKLKLKNVLDISGNDRQEKPSSEKSSDLLANTRPDFSPEVFPVGHNDNNLEETKIALWVLNSNITDPNTEDVLNFANTDFVEQAGEFIMDKLKGTKSEFVFEKIEKPLIPIIKKMEERGVLLNVLFLEKLKKEYLEEIVLIEEQIWKLSGFKFNIASPKQLSEVLFEKLKLTIKYQKKTSTGAKSTKESELQKMKDLHPIIPLILEYRELSKLVSTYLQPMIEMVDEKNRLHAKFIQTGTTTGRMASQSPNLQNIPTNSERGIKIRNAFIAPENFSLVSFDYSQVELRIAAFLSKDEKLINIFKLGEDVHTAVASYVFGVSADNVTKEMRRKAKIINFGILYGMGVNALMQNLNSDRNTSQEFLNTYFEKFDGLSKYLEDTKKQAEKSGFTETFFGRRRYFDGIKSKIPYIKATAERMAINAPIQGTSADIIKIAMKKVDDFIKQNNYENKIYLILQIHDELIYEIEDSILKEVAPKIKEIMQNILTKEETLGVPIVTNYLVGKVWGKMEK